MRRIASISGSSTGVWPWTTSFGSGFMWRAGVTLDYQVVENLNAKLTATYVKEDYGNQTVDGRSDADWVEGFFRLQRDF